MKKIIILLLMVCMAGSAGYAGEITTSVESSQQQKKRKHLKPRKHKHGHLKYSTLAPRKKYVKRQHKRNQSSVRLPAKSKKIIQ